MIKRQFLGFLLHWLASSLGIFLCLRFFGEVSDNSVQFYILAGLVFSLVNSILRPLAKTIALPLSLLTLGLSTLLVNTAMTALTFWIVQNTNLTFLDLFFISIVMSLINGLVNLLVLRYIKK